MEKPPTKEEVFGHKFLAWELLKAECAMKSISLNLSAYRASESSVRFFKFGRPVPKSKIINVVLIYA